jgi:hypothetical protein
MESFFCAINGKYFSAFIFSGLFKISNQYSIKGTVFNIGVAVGIGSFLFFLQ